MAEAGVRGLRDNLSRYLDRVRAGEELTVTDRGRVVARLVPASERRPFDRLVTEGLIEPAPESARHAPAAPLDLGVPVSDLVAEQRR